MLDCLVVEGKAEPIPYFVADISRVVCHEIGTRCRPQKRGCVFGLLFVYCVYYVTLLVFKRGCSNVLIHLSADNPKPMYEQVVDEVERLIATGTINPGEMLPSIRELSKQLMTSGITIRRAYQELERSGFIYTRAGKGSFISSLSEEQRTEWKMRQVEDPLQESIQQAKKLKLSQSQFLEMTKQVWADLDEE